jgi:hypothetical protein
LNAHVVSNPFELRLVSTTLVLLPSHLAQMSGKFSCYLVQPFPSAFPPIRPWIYGALPVEKAALHQTFQFNLLTFYLFILLHILERQTRSGGAFSPYMLPFGSPIHVGASFDITQVLSDLNAAHMAREDDGFESEDERGIEPPRPSDSSTSSSHSYNPSSNGPESASSSRVSNIPALPRPDLTRKQKHSKQSRLRRRSARQELLPPDTRHLKSIALKRRKRLEAIPTPTDAEDLNAASTGWIGVRIPDEKRALTLEEVTSAPYNLRHVKWDGR